MNTIYGYLIAWRETPALGTPRVLIFLWHGNFVAQPIVGMVYIYIYKIENRDRPAKSSKQLV